MTSYMSKDQLNFDFSVHHPFKQLYHLVFFYFGDISFHNVDNIFFDTQVYN